MEDIYTFKVDNDMFERILSGKKTIHLALNMPKYKSFMPKNQLTFERDTQNLNADSLSKNANGEVISSVKVEIENLYYFTDIREAVETLGKEKCGFKPSQTFEKASDIFLSTEKYEKVEKNGVIAIAFKLI